MKARAIVAAALLVVAAACGDATVTGEAPAATTPSTAAPAPPATTPAPATTTTTTTTVAPLPTTTTAPGWDHSAARALYEEIAADRGWRIPDVAREDYAADACGRELWDATAAFVFGEQLLFDQYLSWPVPQHDRPAIVAAARLGWALAAMSCPDRFPPATLAAGPPDLTDAARCDRVTWAPHALPWSSGADTADEARILPGGELELAWHGPAGERLTVVFGRGDAWREIVAAGNALPDFGAGSLGPVRHPGHRAWVVVGGETTTVAWETGPEFCHATTASLTASSPDPLADLAATMFTPLESEINAAELRMWQAVQLLRGFDHIGGEPSHGGGDAVHWMTDSRGTGYFLWAIPVERFAAIRSRTDWVDVERTEAAGAPVTVWLPSDRDGLVASAIVDGFVVEATADLETGDLLEFMDVWVETWRAASAALDAS